jgi:hypothetical protein
MFLHQNIKSVMLNVVSCIKCFTKWTYILIVFSLCVCTVYHIELRTNAFNSKKSSEVNRHILSKFWTQNWYHLFMQPHLLQCHVLYIEIDEKVVPNLFVL